MNAFQFLAVGLLSLLALRDIIGLRSNARNWMFSVTRIALWTCAAVAVLLPGLVQEVALALGIGRGADVILYLTVLAFLVWVMYQYAWNLRLEEKMTILVREAAIRDGRFGGEGGDRAASSGAKP